MWAWIYETRQRELAQILAAGDAAALARELASMFRSTFVLGMAPGAFIDHSHSFVGGRIWRVKSVDGLISLAEALGIAAVQDAEQGSGTSARWTTGRPRSSSVSRRSSATRSTFPASARPMACRSTAGC